MAKRKKTFAEKIAETPVDEFSSMTESELKSEVKRGRFAVSRRLGSFKRAGLESAAAIQYFDTGKLRRDKTPEVNRATLAKVARDTKVGDMSRNQALMELARIQAFFRSKTSTVKGQQEVNRRQDIAIFGADEKGNPIDTMSNEERTKLWSVYMEYYNQHPETYSHTGWSTDIQKMLGTIVKGTPNLDKIDVSQSIENISEALELGIDLDQLEIVKKWFKRHNKEYTKEEAFGKLNEILYGVEPKKKEEFVPNVLVGNRNVVPTAKGMQKISKALGRPLTAKEKHKAQRGNLNVRAKRGNNRGR